MKLDNKLELTCTSVNNIKHVTGELTRLLYNTLDKGLKKAYVEIKCNESYKFIEELALDLFSQSGVEVEIIR